MNNKRKIIFILIFVIIIVFLIRYMYQNNVNKKIYTGCIVVAQQGGEKGKWFVLNPNNLSECIILDFRKYQKQLGKDFIRLILDDNNIYLIARNFKDKSPYHIVKIKNADMEILPVKFPYSLRQDVLLFSIKDFLIFVDDKNIYFISKQDYKTTNVYKNRKEYTNVLPYKEGVISINSNNEMVYVQDTKIEVLLNMPQEYIFEGWFKRDKYFLVYDDKRERSIVINLSGEVMETFGNQPYTVLGSADDNAVLLKMLPEGAGGATPFDFEYDLIDVLRKEHRRCYIPFIYDIENKNIKNLNMETQPSYNSWQDFNFDKEYLEKLSEMLI